MDVIQAYTWISTSSPNMLINWHFIVIQEWIKWKKKQHGTPCRVLKKAYPRPCLHWNICVSYLTVMGSLMKKWRKNAADTLFLTTNKAQIYHLWKTEDKIKVCLSSPTQKSLLELHLNVSFNTSIHKKFTLFRVTREISRVSFMKQDMSMNEKSSLQASISKTCLFLVHKGAQSPPPLRTRLPASSTYRNTKTPSKTISQPLFHHSLSLTKPTRRYWRRGAVLNWRGGQITWEREELPLAHRRAKLWEASAELTGRLWCWVILAVNAAAASNCQTGLPPSTDAQHSKNTPHL